MAPKEKTKRTMTPEQLEKLAVARAKANEVRQAMKEGREDAQVAALQAKMDILKAKKKPPLKEPTVPEEPEPTSVPTPDEETHPDKEEKVAKPAPAPVPEPVPEPEPTQAGPPVEKLQCKKKKKKVIVMPSSDTSDSEDDSNVIFVKKTSRKKKETHAHVPPQPPPTPQLPQAHINRPPTNPFFAWNNPITYSNFR